jgi:hypothetical protein
MKVALTKTVSACLKSHFLRRVFDLAFVPAPLIQNVSINWRNPHEFTAGDYMLARNILP